MNTGTALTLASSSADLLVRLLGMCGSDHAGERATAALKADQLVRRHGLTWTDIIRVPGRDHFVERTERKNHYADGWRQMRTYCLRHADYLTPREHDFIHDLSGWYGELTSKQEKWLLSIYFRVQREASL